VETIGALIMGSTTYKQTVGWGWEWGDLPTMVLTTGDSLDVPDGANVQFTATPTPEAIRSFSAATPKRLWVFGGGKVITDGLIGGAVDTLDITVIPEAIGSGIPLFSDSYDGPMRLEESIGYSNGAVRLIYRTRP
jgi:dihydrofolate reductase